MGKKKKSKRGKKRKHAQSTSSLSASEHQTRLLAHELEAKTRALAFYERWARDLAAEQQMITRKLNALQGRHNKKIASLGAGFAQGGDMIFASMPEINLTEENIANVLHEAAQSKQAHAQRPTQQPSASSASSDDAATVPSQTDIDNLYELTNKKRAMLQERERALIHVEFAVSENLQINVQRERNKTMETLEKREKALLEDMDKEAQLHSMTVKRAKAKSELSEHLLLNEIEKRAEAARKLDFVAVGPMLSPTAKTVLEQNSRLRVELANLRKAREDAREEAMQVEKSVLQMLSKLEASAGNNNQGTKKMDYKQQR